MRRLILAAVSAALVLTGCSDRESPTEPAVPQPEETFSSSCTVDRFPLLAVATQIAEVFPKGRLRLEALARAGIIKLYWDTCHEAEARRVAVAFISWMNLNFDAGRLPDATEEEVQTLTVTILNGVGVAVTEPTATGDIGVGIYDGEKTVIKTASEVALTEIEADAFADGEPRLIVVKRLADNFQLLSFGGDQFPPYFDYDATKLEGPTLPADKALATDKFAIIAFCLLPQTEEFQYPDQPRIGHNPVAGADPDAFEILDPVALVAGADGDPRPDLAAELECENLAPNPGPIIGSFSRGLPNFAQAAFGKAERILGPMARSLLLPQPLSATAATAMVGLSGPIAGKTTNLSPFGVVEGRLSTSTSITSDDPDPSIVGQEITVSILVTARTEAKTIRPTGTVQVTDGNGASCTATLDLVAVPKEPGNIGECTLTPTTVGTVELTAVYSGNSELNGSRGTEPHTVIAAPSVNGYSVNSSSDGLWAINLLSGAASFIGRLGGANLNLYTTAVAMGVRPSDAKLFVWSNSGDGIEASASTGVLLTVDPNTGLGSPADPETPDQGNLGALAFSPSGALFGVESSLYTVDASTGVSTLVGPLGSELRVGGADFSCSGILYGLELNGQRLVTINTSTGAASVVATLSQDLGTTGSIVFTPSGTLVGSALGEQGSVLFDINPVNGQVSGVRPLSTPSAQGMGIARTCSVIN